MIHRIPASDYQVLVDLHTSTDGYQWHLAGTPPDRPGDYNWLDPNAGFWDAVGVVGFEWNDYTCVISNIGHVAHFGLRTRQMRGTLPASLGNLTGQQDWDFSYNQIVGPLPVGLGRAKGRIDLEHNLIMGQIPIDLGDMGDYIGLAQNQLSGSIPASFANAQSVVVSDNLLSGNLPSTLASSTSLRYLDIRYNYFDVSPGSANRDLINAMLQAGKTVLFDPQKSAAELIAHSIRWNHEVGGLDFTYVALIPTLSTTTAKLFWANGTTAANILPGPPISTDHIPAGFSGQSTSIHVPASDLMLPPNDATHILLVVDPDNLIIEGSENNNTLALGLGFSLLFRESDIGSFGFGPDGIPGWDHVGLYGKDRVYESHPGYPTGTYWDPERAKFISIANHNGVQAQHTKGSFQYDAQMAPSKAGNVEVKLGPALSMRMTAFIETQLSAEFLTDTCNGDFTFSCLQANFQPDRQKNKTGAGYTCVGLIERAAEEAGLNDGEGFVPDYLETLGTVPNLLPGTLLWCAKGLAIGEELYGLADPVDFILTDPMGRRLGHTAALGTLNEIPAAYYSGDGNLEQFIIPRPLPGQYNLQLIGLGAPAGVVVGGYFESQLSEGYLGVGEQRNMTFTVPPAPLRLLSPQLTSTALSVSFATYSNKYYTVQATSNLNPANWSSVTDVLGNGSIIRVSLPVRKNVPQLFYRVMSTGTSSQIPPALTAQPVSRTNAPGTLATFSVLATGTPPLSYQWRKNGTNLNSGGNISGATSTTLSLTNVQPFDAGSYDVVVSNPFGTNTSQTATLALWSQPALIDFESGTPPQITGSGVRESVQGYAGIGGFSGFLFRNSSRKEPTTFTLTNLAPHTAVSLGFLLAAIDSWDGTSPDWGPDYFRVTVEGNIIFNESIGWYNPSFIPDAGVDLSPSTNLGWNTFNDGAFNMALQHQFQNIPHTGSSITVRFQSDGAGWGGGDDESFALDNIQITLHGMP